MSVPDLRYVAGWPIGNIGPAPGWEIVETAPEHLKRATWRWRSVCWLRRARECRLYYASALAYGDERKIDHWRRTVVEQVAYARSCRKSAGPVLP